MARGPDARALNLPPSGVGKRAGQPLSCPTHDVKPDPAQRALPLLICIAAGMVLSWVAIYAFWFAVPIFHSVPAARFCDAAGRIFLLPARFIFNRMGGDQSALFFDPLSFSATNGLVLGVAFYAVLRVILDSRAAKRAKRQ